MAAASREQIFAALFAQVSSSAFVTMSRRMQHYANVDSASQPALFQSEGKQTAAVVAGKPTKWTFRAALAIYAHAQTANPDDLTSTLNDLVDGVVAALDREPATERQTLGGLVYDCRVQGDIETDEGFLGDQAVALIPIEIITNL